MGAHKARSQGEFEQFSSIRVFNYTPRLAFEVSLQAVEGGPGRAMDTREAPGYADYDVPVR